MMIKYPGERIVYNTRATNERERKGAGADAVMKSGSKPASSAPLDTSNEPLGLDYSSVDLADPIYLVFIPDSEAHDYRIPTNAQYQDNVERNISALCASQQQNKALLRNHRKFHDELRLQLLQPKLPTCSPAQDYIATNKAIAPRYQPTQRLIVDPCLEWK